MLYFSMQHQNQLTKILNGSNILFEFFKYMNIVSLIALTTNLILANVKSSKTTTLKQQDIQLVRKTKRA
jgi:hypothetical protein